MHPHLTSASCALLLLPLLTGGAQAAEPEGFDLDLNAYGTLSAVHSSEDKADFVASLQHAEGAGFSDSVAYGIDSRVGLQLTATFTPKLTAVVQVVSEQRYDKSYSPVVEWANVKYDVTPDFSLRAGRIVLPILMTSEYLRVGYATHWVRPPVEVYRMIPVTNNDGIDASWRKQFGDYTYTLLAYTGNRDAELARGKVRGENSSGLINTLEFGNMQLRLGLTRSNLDAASIDGFFDLFRQFGTQGDGIADRYDFASKMLKAAVLGAHYDSGNWFAMAEWIHIDMDSFVGTSNAWYISGGYRFGHVTPFVTYSRKDSLEDFSHEPGLDVGALPPALQGYAAGLNAGLAEFLRPTDSATLSVGTRWDFADRFSFTVQLDHVRAGTTSFGTAANVQPGLAPGASKNVLTAAFSFVY